MDTKLFIIRSLLKHNTFYRYDITEYKNPQTKVRIICPQHGEFKQLPYDHLAGKGCPECKREKLRLLKRDTREIFISKANNIFNNFYIYENLIYKGSQIKITVTCPKHGDFVVLPNNHLKGYGCQKCSKEEKNKKKQNRFIKKAKILHNNFYNYENVIYTGINDKVCIICPKHGEFHQTPKSHLKYKCQKCALEELTIMLTHTKEDFILKAIEEHGQYYDYLNVIYKNAHTKVEIICPEHGIFNQLPCNHIQGNGCPICSLDKHKSKVSQKWLDYCEIIDDEFHREISILLKNNQKIRVDGFDSETNTIYEFWGDFWHGNPRIYDLNSYNQVNGIKMEVLYNETMKRKKLILETGYSLIDIWECDWKLLEKQISPIS